MSRRPALWPRRDHWQLARHTRWAGGRTLVGGDPFRAVRLTERGAAFVRSLIAGPCGTELGPAERTLMKRLARGNLVTRPTREPGSIEATLVIPAHAAADDVQRVLDSAPRRPAIVVDDGSPVPLAAQLAHDAPLTVIRHDEPLGPAAARNAGARAATTPWVAFADADLVACAGWIAALGAYADEVVAIAPRITTEPAGGLAAQFEQAVCALDMGSDPGYVSPSGFLSYVPSAALLVRRQDFLDAGGFDEQLRVGEDVDLVWRLADQGVYYEPTVVVSHRARRSLAAALGRRAEYGVSSGALADRHPGLMRHGSFPAQTAIPWLLWIAGRPMAACATALVGLAVAPRGLPAIPPAAAVSVKARAQLRSAEALSRMLTRPMLPLALALSLLHKGFRRRAAIAIAISVLVQRRSPSGAIWQLLDDAAYSSGVWRAAVLRRDPQLVLPRLRWSRR